MTSSSINNVLVLGAGGNVARSTIKALLEENFTVTGLTRDTSKAVLPAGVKHVKSGYSEASLIEIFKGQDAIVSTVSSIVPGDALAIQETIVNAAIGAGVKVFIPSEYSVDTSNHVASTYIPFLKDKIDTLDYLKTQQDKISWTAIVSGSMFDWGLKIPGFGGLDVSARTATIFDGGDIPYEATNLDQVGRAIAKSLKNPEATRNEYVYVNSFTVTQNQVVRALERATGEKFETSHGTVEGLWQDGATQVKEGQLLGTLAMLAGAIYGKGGLANFSVTKGLGDEKLGLPQEDLDAFIKGYMTGKK
ncbi:NmrA domain-containing protein [Fusarium sp. LHS14.1]|nr:NmrA domain-containing protein [Fusarium sp. LHS14.1]